MAKGYKPDEHSEFQRSRRKTQTRLAQLERAKSRLLEKARLEAPKLKDPPPSLK